MSTDTKKLHFPHTGSKLSDVGLIIIVILSILGIVSFTYSGIDKILNGNLFGALPNIMFVLMYVNILQYIYSFFVNRKKASSIGPILTSYCMLTIMTTVLLPNIQNYYILLILMVLIVIFVPLMGKDLTNFKRCTLILLIVLGLVITMSVLKLDYGVKEIGGQNPFLYMVSMYDVFHPLFVWIIFMALYMIRTRYYIRTHKNEINEKGFKAVQQEAKADLEKAREAEELAKKQEKAKKKEHRKEKHHNK